MAAAGWLSRLSSAGGKLYIIDTGISRAYWGRASAWECRGGDIWEVTASGRKLLAAPEGEEKSGIRN